MRELAFNSGATLCEAAFQLGMHFNVCATHGGALAIGTVVLCAVALGALTAVFKLTKHSNI